MTVTQDLIDAKAHLEKGWSKGTYLYFGSPFAPTPTAAPTGMCMAGAIGLVTEGPKFVEWNLQQVSEAGSEAEWQWSQRGQEALKELADAIRLLLPATHPDLVSPVELHSRDPLEVVTWANDWIANWDDMWSWMQWAIEAPSQGPFLDPRTEPLPVIQSEPMECVTKELALV